MTPTGCAPLRPPDGSLTPFRDQKMACRERLARTYKILYYAGMDAEDLKPVRFRGRSLEDFRDFPATAKREAGYQIGKV